MALVSTPHAISIVPKGIDVPIALIRTVADVFGLMYGSDTMSVEFKDEHTVLGEPDRSA